MAQDNGGQSRKSSAKSRKADRAGSPNRIRTLRERRRRRAAELQRVRRRLEGLMQADVGDAQDIRLLEALRRRRLTLLVEIEKLDRWIEQAKPIRGKRVVQGPKGGVRSVVQAGAPGLGKRS